MLQSFFSRLGRWTELPMSFEFTVGEEVVLPFALPCNFLLFACRRKSDDTPASVFVQYKKQPSFSCSCSSKGGRCSSCTPSGGAGGGGSATGAHLPPPSEIAAALATSSDVVQLGKQHMRRVKTLLHPDLLKVLQTYESDAAIYIVTERCWPLPLLPEWEKPESATALRGRSNSSTREHQQQHEGGAVRGSKNVVSASDYSRGGAHVTRNQEQHHALSPNPSFEKASTNAANNATTTTTTSTPAVSPPQAELEATVAAAAKADVAWGLLQVANAVAFLQDSCHMVHGQVNPLSIFVTADGSWKLSALELVRPFPHDDGCSQTSCKGNDRQQHTLARELLDDQRRSAAYLQGWHPPDRVDVSVPVQCADWWGLASVLVWSYSTLMGRGEAVRGQEYVQHGQACRVNGSSSSYSNTSFSYASYSYRYGGGTYGSGGSPSERNLFDLSSATVQGTAPYIPPAARQLLQQLLYPMHQGLQKHHQHHQHQSSSGGSQGLMCLSDILKQTPFFSESSTCHCMLFLREVHVKGAYEKETFFEKQLPRLLQTQQQGVSGDTEQYQQHQQRQVDSLPQQPLPLAVQQQQVLPELLKLLDPTTCTSTGSGNTYGAAALEGTSGVLAPAVVGCVAIIAATMKPEESATTRRGLSAVAASAADLQVQRLRVVLEKLFKSRDRALRYTLLTALDDFEALMTRDLCEHTINGVLLGLFDTTPVIREATIKGLVVFCKKIATQRVLQTCLEQLRRLTGDPEVVLRTNACICAAKICSLPETISIVSRSEKLQQLLAQVLLTAMKDSFPLCRVASLQSVQHSLSAFPDQVAMLTLTPAVAAAAVDPDISVAEAAVSTLQMLVTNVANATAERRRAASYSAQAATAADATAEPNENTTGEQKIGGVNSSTSDKTDASSPSTAGMNFSNGGWFGVVARRLRNSLGVAGMLSNSSSSELQNSTSSDNYTMSSTYGTSATCNTNDTSVGTSSTKPVSYSVNKPPRPPPVPSEPRGPLVVTTEAPMGASNVVATTAEDLKTDSVQGIRKGSVAPAENSLWDDAWQDVCEIPGAGLQNGGTVAGGGGTAYAGHSGPPRQAGNALLAQGTDSVPIWSPGAAASASTHVTLSDMAARVTTHGAMNVAVGGSSRGFDVRAEQDVMRGSGGRISACFLASTSKATAGQPASAGMSAVTGSAVGISAPPTATTTTSNSSSKLLSAGGDDFFAEMERQLREHNY